jgi:hypothetical protein
VVNRTRVEDQRGLSRIEELAIKITNGLLLSMIGIEPTAS